MSNGKNFEQYLSIEKAGGARWHPNDDKVVFASDATGIFQVCETKIEPRKIMPRRQLTSEMDRCTNPRYLDNGSIAFVRDRGGDENFQIGLIDREYELHWLTDDLKAKHILHMSTDEYLYFSANLEDRSRLDLHQWAIPLGETKSEVMYRPEEGLVFPSAISESGEHVVLCQYLGNVNQHLLLLEKGSRQVTNLTEALTKGHQTRWDATRWLDSEHILVLTDHESDKNRPAILSLSGDFYSLPEVDELLKFEVEEFAHRKDSKWTYFVENQDGYSTIHRGEFDSTSVTNLETLPFPIRGVIPVGDQRSWTSGIQLSHDERRLAVTLSSGIQPMTVWILDIKDMTDWRAVDVSTAGLNPKDFVEPTLHDFKSFDDTRVPYFRYIPQGMKPSSGWPTILIIHGGPESQMVPSFDPVLQFYLSGGFAIVAPNIRGSSGYGREYLDADNVDKRLDSIMDIKELALHLKEENQEVDGNRLVIYGGSYGGFAVLSSMTEHPELWKCGVDIVGISNFVTFLKNTAAWRRSLREAEYGSPEHDMDTLIRISPINQIDRISAPLMIIQGDNDERVPLSESTQMYEKLKEKGLEVKMLRFADEGHGLAKRENRIEAYTEVMAWLQKNA